MFVLKSTYKADLSEAYRKYNSLVLEKCLLESRVAKYENLEKERARREKNGRFKAKAKKKGLLI